MAELIVLLIVIGLGWVFLSIFFPNLNKKRCGYCNEYHRGNKQYWNKAIGKSVITTSARCYELWMKENYICENCNSFGPHTTEVIEHKFKRKYFYFCSLACKENWEINNPEKFYEDFHRQSIPNSVRKTVWNRDGGKCSKCGSKDEIEFDHIIPVAKGGPSTVNNIELLCKTCNRSKSDKIE